MSDWERALMGVAALVGLWCAVRFLLDWLGDADFFDWEQGDE